MKKEKADSLYSLLESIPELDFEVFYFHLEGFDSQTINSLLDVDDSKTICLNVVMYIRLKFPRIKMSSIKEIVSQLADKRYGDMMEEAKNAPRIKPSKEHLEKMKSLFESYGAVFPDELFE